MSSHSPSILLGQRVRPAADDVTSSDLQQMVGKVLSVLRYRRWLFILPLLTGVMTVLAGSLLVPRQYALRTAFERRDDPVLLKLVANSPYSFESQRRTLRYSIIGSGAIDEALGVVAPRFPELSGPSAKSGRSALAAELGSELTVAVANSSPNYDLIELRYSGRRPDLAEAVLPVLRDNYVRNAQAALRDVQQKAQAFFAEQVEKRQAQAARMQAELSQQVVESPAIDPGKPGFMQERVIAENLEIEKLTRQRNEIQTEIQAREEYIRELGEQQKEGKLPSGLTFSSRVIESPLRSQLQANISQVTAELADAKTVRRMKETHPYVESLNRKLLQLQLEYEQAGRTNITHGTQEQSPWDAERTRIEMELKSLRGRRDQFERDLAVHQAARQKLEDEKSTLFERQQQYTLRSQELGNLQADLAVWQTKLEEIDRILVAENVDRGVQFFTVEECRRPVKPMNPKLQGIYLFSGAAGLGLAIAVVFLRELMDRSFRNPARVRQLLGIPVLEAIGEIRVRRSAKRWASTYVPPALAMVQVCVIVGLGWLVYLRLERPDAYAVWIQELGTRFGDVSAFLA